VARGYLGVYVAEISADLVESFGLPANGRGVAVTEVVEDSAAAEAGLRAQDVITSIDGKPVGSRADLGLIVSQKAPGATTKIDFVRDGESHTVEVVLGKQPEEVDPSAPLLEGVTLEMLTADRRRQLNIDASLDGLYVTDVQRTSPYRSKLEPGMVIVTINQEMFTDISSARRLLKSGTNKLLIQNGRNEPQRYIGIEIK